MKRWLKMIGMCLVILSMVMSTTVFAKEISVTLNGVPINFDVQPQIMNDRTMVPLRAIFEALGATVEWDKNTQTVTAYSDDTTVIATIGSKYMYINYIKTAIDVAPVIVNGRTLVPARFVAEAFDCEVDWDGDSRTVIITQDNENDVYEDLGEQGED